MEIINWRIVIGLIRYDGSSLKLDGYRSYFDLIEKTVNFNTGIAYPLIGASAYILASPALRNLIREYNVYSNRWGQDWSIQIAKPGSVPITEMIEIRNSYTAKLDNLEKIVKSYKQYEEKSTNLQSEIMRLTQHIKNSDAEKGDITAMSNIYSYDGEWEITYIVEGKQSSFFHF